MAQFDPKAIAENFAGWVNSMASLTGYQLHSTNNLFWYSASLPHPMYSYGYNVGNDNRDDLAVCIESFINSKTLFYFCNGIWHEGKKHSKLFTDLGAESFGNLDGLYFDLSQESPVVNPSVTIQIKQVENEVDYAEFGEVTAMASEQSPEIGKLFYSDFSKLKGSPLQLFIAYLDDKPVGCSMLYAPEGEIAGNYSGWVIPQYRKKGINSAMVVERLNRAKAAGYKYLIAQCMDTSTRLYTGLNFEKVCELDFYGKASY